MLSIYLIQKYINCNCNLCDGKATFSGIFTPVSIDTTPNIINVYTVTFDQFNALFLNKSIKSIILTKTFEQFMLGENASLILTKVKYQDLKY